MKSNSSTPPNAGFSNLDIGSPQLAGSAEQVGNGWDIVAGGVDIWEKSDQFHFVHKQVAGDFDIAIRVESFTPAHLYSKAGLMIRESLSPNSAHLMFLVFSDNSPRNNNLGTYEMKFRLVEGGVCHAVYPAVKPPAPPEFPAAYPNSWLRVQRSGNQFSAFASTNGKAWKAYGVQTLKCISGRHSHHTTPKLRQRLGFVTTPNHNRHGISVHGAHRNEESERLNREGFDYLQL